MTFLQDPPVLENSFSKDGFLQDYLEGKLPANRKEVCWQDLLEMGELAAGKMLDLAIQAENSPPTLVNFDPWGRRIDLIKTSPAWQELDAIAAQKGLIANGYDPELGWQGRVFQMALLYLYHPSSAVYSCPLAMTDGAVTVLKLFADDELKQRAIPHLTSRNPDRFWTSGQWMTEKAGGSDVGQTATMATPKGDHYLLNGDKWFTSATTSQMAITLARTPDAPAGSRGLSLFYVETHNEDGVLNGIQIHRLKDKLGTRALPTAELSLINAKAKLVGELGHGVRKIASMFNITRIYNSVCAISGMRRAVDLAKNYAEKRVAFGQKLSQKPLHCQTLCDLEVRCRASFLLTFFVVELQGKCEHLPSNRDHEALLRILTPICKLFTAKEAVAVISEALECFGGAGYIEDTGIPVMLRNTQVLSIWEGTTNVLSLDLLRALHGEGNGQAFFKQCYAWLKGIESNDLSPLRNKVQTDLETLQNQFEKLPSLSRELIEAGARNLAFAMARIAAACLLLEAAESAVPRSREAMVWTAHRHCMGFSVDALFPTQASLEKTVSLAFS